MTEFKHVDAFEYYYSLGSARSYEQVAQVYKVHNRTVEKWGSKEKWQEEVKKRDAEVYKICREKAIKSKVERISAYAEINKAIVDNLEKRVRKGGLDNKGVRSYLDIAKFDLLLPDLEELVYEKLIGSEDRNDIAESVGTQPAGVKIKGQFYEGIDIVLDIKGGAEDYE